jgi:hypothetical protein
LKQEQFTSNYLEGPRVAYTRGYASEGQVYFLTRSIGCTHAHKQFEKSNLNND